MTLFSDCYIFSYIERTLIINPVVNIRLVNNVIKNKMRNAV